MPKIAPFTPYQKTKALALSSLSLSLPTHALSTSVFFAVSLPAMGGAAQFERCLLHLDLFFDLDLDLLTFVQLRS